MSFAACVALLAPLAGAAPPEHEGLPALPKDLLDPTADTTGLKGQGPVAAATLPDGTTRRSTDSWAYLLARGKAGGDLGTLTYEGRELTCTPGGVLETPFGELMYTGPERGWQTTDAEGRPLDMSTGIAVELEGLLYGFDIVETFDHTADWTGTGHGGVARPDRMPRGLDGRPSRWGFYSIWNRAKPADKWIANHGPQKTLGGTGKSLCIDYAGLEGGPMGPSRLATCFGKGRPDSGYEDIYVFFRVRLSRDFYPPFKDGKPTWWGYHKFVVLSLGYRDADNWGTVEQQRRTTRVQHSRCYGLNCAIINTLPWDRPRGISLADNVLVGVKRPDGRTYYHYPKTGAYGRRFAERSKGKIDKHLDTWFGLELHYKRGDVGKPNGQVRYWVYDQDGNATKIHDVEGVLLIDLYDHKYNRFEFGGNRYSPHFRGAKTGTIYFDDFIINGSRIGPNYFRITKKGERIGVGSDGKTKAGGAPGRENRSRIETRQLADRASQ